MLLVVLLATVPASACVYPARPDPVTPSNNKCSSGSCYIRSANVCCPNGYLNYAGAGYGCYTNRQSCLDASGGKCWYETSCIP